MASKAHSSQLEVPEKTDDKEMEPTLVMQSMLWGVAMLEGADTALLGASMKALTEDIGLALHDISYMTVAQMVCTNIAAPLWGILADRNILSRRSILIIGSLGQGLVTGILAIVTSLWPMIFLRAMNGIMLAALRPISNGIVADMTAEDKRGKVFGRVQSALLCGMFLTSMTVVPIATETIVGIQGWRLSYVAIGFISCLVSMYIKVAMPDVDPPAQEETGSGKESSGAFLEEITHLLQFFKMPTFCVMILQGIFGTIPWSVFGYMALFYQLAGISNGEVAIISGAGPITGAVGTALGGVVADKLAERFGLHGRPLTAQISVSISIPVMYLCLVGIPPGNGSFWTYMLLTTTLGIFGSWPAAGTNYPVLSHIVPPSARSRIMAWECALENSIANAVGPMVVSFLAEDVFGYTFGEHSGSGTDIPSAKALGKALGAVVCMPWFVCFFFYSTLHWTYPRDVKLLEAQDMQAKKLEKEVSMDSMDTIVESKARTEV